MKKNKKKEIKILDDGVSNKDVDGWRCCSGTVFGYW